MRTSILFLLCVFSFFSFEAQGQVKHNAAVQLTRTSFNTSSDDYPNAMTKSGGRLYVTSERSSKQKIYFVDGNGAEWSSMKEIDGAINNAQHSGSATLTADGQYVIFAAYSHEVEGSGRTDLYSARKEGGEWRDVQNLGTIVNSNAWDAAPSLTQDGTVLYFSSDRTGGKGGTDIYLTKRTREGWTKPQNMNEINTSSDETTPYIAADGKTFYFASTRSGGAGGLDVYFAVPNPEMPSPVTIMRGIVSDKVTGKPLGADIVITDLKTRKQVATLRSDDITGEYYVTIPGDRDYSITARKPDYLFYSERMTVPAVSKGAEVTKDIALSPYSQGETRLLVFFDFDKAELKEESYPDLDNAIQFLQEKSDVKIRIEGYTDNVGDKNYNVKLSADRANAVSKYLANNGIDKSRITTKGFGEENPVAPNTSDENRARNRRVEMKVVQ